jgi:hypothetical protein
MQIRRQIDKLAGKFDLRQTGEKISRVVFKGLVCRAIKDEIRFGGNDKIRV